MFAISSGHCSLIMPRHSYKATKALAQIYRTNVKFYSPNGRGSVLEVRAASDTVNSRLSRTPTDKKESKQHTQMLAKRHLNSICLRSKINLRTCEKVRTDNKQRNFALVTLKAIQMKRSCIKLMTMQRSFPVSLDFNVPPGKIKEIVCSMNITSLQRCLQALNSPTFPQQLMAGR